MYLTENDIVTEVCINPYATDFASVVRICEPLIAELGVSAVEISRADPHGLRNGHTVDLRIVSQPTGFTITQSFRRAAEPVLARFGLTGERLEVRRPEDAPPWGNFLRAEKIFPEFNVFNLVTQMGAVELGRYRDGFEHVVGAHELLSPWRRKRTLSVPHEDPGIVARVHAWVPAPDLATALRMCSPLVRDIDAIVVDVMPAPREVGCGGYSVAMLSVLTSQNAEAGDQVQQLRRAATRLDASLGLNGNRLTIHNVGTDLVGSLELDPAEVDFPKPSGGAHALYVREEVDPFLEPLAPEEQEIEELVPDYPESPLTAHDLLEWQPMIEWTTKVQVGFIADVIGADPLDAREIVRELVTRLRHHVHLTGDQVNVGEPLTLDDGSIRVGAHAGGIEADSLQATEAVIAALGGGDWAEPHIGKEHGLIIIAQWQARNLPERGLTRLELNVGPGTAFVPLELEDDETDDT
jgi:hypothetical protein